MTGNTKPPARKPPPGSSAFTSHLSRFIQNWLFQLGPDTRLPIVLNQRRIFILPTGGGLLYALMLVIMLLGAINYDLSLGHALVFLLAGLGFVGMVHAFRNLIALRLTPLRAEPVFAGETARFRLRVENPRDHDRRAHDRSNINGPVLVAKIDHDKETENTTNYAHRMLPFVLMSVSPLTVRHDRRKGKPAMPQA